jgi:hypothetical protein
MRTAVTAAVLADAVLAATHKAAGVDILIAKVVGSCKQIVQHTQRMNRKLNKSRTNAVRFVALPFAAQPHMSNSIFCQESELQPHLPGEFASVTVS